MSANLVTLAQDFIKIEAQAIQHISNLLDEKNNAKAFHEAVNLIVNGRGKLVFCGIGKSGHIAAKLASTFSSVGIPALYLHPSEKDVLFFISYSGETAELSIPLKFAARKKIPVISLTGNMASTLAKHSTVVLNTSVPKEACPYNLAPTASTTAALVMGDALGLVCAMQKGYSADKFAEIHPAGNLGLRLMMVKELMSDAKQVPTVHANENIKNLISKMTHGTVRGAAAVVDAAGKLVGTVSDGDIRRFLEQDVVDLKAPVSMVMSNNPKTIRSTDLVEQALAKLEEFKIQFLFVVEDSGQFVGLVHVNSILGKKLR